MKRRYRALRNRHLAAWWAVLGIIFAFAFHKYSPIFYKIPAKKAPLLERGFETDYLTLREISKIVLEESTFDTPDSSN